MEPNIENLHVGESKFEQSEDMADNVSSDIPIENQSPGKKKDEMEESPSMQFSPPIYIQRYCRVNNILKEMIPMIKDPSKTILEVGCAEFSMHVYLSKLEGVEKLIYLDLDEDLLKQSSRKIQPLLIDYLIKRETPLRVEAYAGCVTKVDPDVLKSVSAVLAIEIVEHLDPDILVGFVESIFGVIKPPLVIVTTPNSEFNVCFDLPPGKFRHWDHRFEWTRSEFDNWCKSVCSLHPSYQYSVEGVGEGPPATVNLGCVSQLAIFRRSAVAEPSQEQGDYREIIQEKSYKLVAEVDYPFYFDPSPVDERIVREFKIYVSVWLFPPARIYDYIEDNRTEIRCAISSVMGIHGMPKGASLEYIATVLENAGYNILRGANENGDPESWAVLPVPEEPVDMSSSDSEPDVSSEALDLLPPANNVYEEETWD